MTNQRSFGVRLAALGLGIAALAGAATSRADVVTEWNTQYINTARVVGGPPCPLSRSVAMMHIAMYDALEAIDHQYTPLIVHDVTAPAGANRQAAIIQAAHDVLASLYPARTAVYDAQLSAELAQIPAGVSRDAGLAVGAAVAAEVISDHSVDAPAMNDNNYVYLNVPGAYQPTFPDFTTPPFNPGWGHCKPWCMLSGDQFRPVGPLGYRHVSNMLKSVKYANAFNEVLMFGKRNSQFRTAEQTEIAWFWANDRNGTYKPAGHLNFIAQIVSVQNHLNLAQNARLFAMINAAMADAGIVAWDAKYMSDVDVWRPITAIRNASTDGNPLTAQNPNWVPLLDFSPPFPGYTSGHGTFAGAWGAAMKAFFGTDNMTFSATSDEPAAAGVVRTFHSFSQAAYEDAESRIWLGVHFRFDAEDAYLSGKRMAEAMAASFFRPTCTADLTGDGVVNSADLTAFTNAYFAGSPVADYNKDGVVNNADVVAYFNAYLAGCSN
jgi:hypothetical protein